MPAWNQAAQTLIHHLNQNPSNLVPSHAFLLRHNLFSSPILYTKLLTLFSHSNLDYTRRIFDSGPHRHDSFLCNIILKGYKEKGRFFDGLMFYKELRGKIGWMGDGFTVLSLVKCCGGIGCVWGSGQVHNAVIRDGFGSDLYVATAVVDMYVKVGAMVDARKVFEGMGERSRVTWTVLVCGYARSGDLGSAREFFDRMPEKDLPAFNAIVDGYVKAGELGMARGLFDGMPGRNVVSWTTMIDGYCSSGEVEMAMELFDAMPEKNLFTWNAMIGGYCQNKRPQEALELFHELQSSRLFEPDDVTIAGVLAAIADLGALELGVWVHQYSQKRRLDMEINVHTAVIHMYAKCGEIINAVHIFEAMETTEIAPWNAMINGFALNGCCDEALQLFEEFTRRGMKPNEITMIGVLSACNHGGLVDVGRKWLNEMERMGLVPRIEHYGCVIDLFGRAGCLEEAEKLLVSMPYEANEIIMSSLLSACGYYPDPARAERILQKAAKRYPSNDGNYVLLRNVYAAERRWTDVEAVKNVMRKNGAKKQTGCSNIEVDNAVSEFVSGDKLHPLWHVIQSVLKWLQLHMKEKNKQGRDFTCLICR